MPEVDGDVVPLDDDFAERVDEPDPDTLAVADTLAVSDTLAAPVREADAVADSVASDDNV